MSLKGRSCYRNSCPRAFPDGSHTRGACPGAFPAPSPVSLCNAGPFFRLAGRGGRPGKGFPQLTDHFRKPSGGEPHRFVRFRVVPRRGIVRLFQQGPDFDFAHELFTVLLHALAPDKRVPVGFRLDLRAVDIFHLKAQEALRGQNKHQLG